MEILFNDRKDAGIQLANYLFKELSDHANLVLLALPRGGVPVAAEISEKFNLPYDVLIVRKIGHPHNEEFGIGAVTEDGSFWIDPLYLNVSAEIDQVIEQTIRHETQELKRRIELYRERKPLPDLSNKTALLIDDGLATGVTARLAGQLVKKLGARDVILAVPVCAAETARKMRNAGIKVKALKEMSHFLSVGEHYLIFDQVSDSEVLDEMKKIRSAYPEKTV